MLIFLYFIFSFCLTQTCEYENLIHSKRVGFGQISIGGFGGSLCEVTTLSNSGAGSLRTCIGFSTPQWIKFKVSGTIVLGSMLYVKSFKTIDGRGADITLTNNGIWLEDSEHVIIHNIKIYDIGPDESGDGITVHRNSKNIWIDHVSVRNCDDELMSVVGEPSPFNVTISNCKFSNSGYAILISSDAAHTDNYKITTTIHDNFFDQTSDRHPLMRFGKIHLLNNYIHKWPGSGADSVTFGQLYSEGNVYENGDSSRSDWALRGRSTSYDPETGYTKTVNDLYLNGAIYQETEPVNVFTPSDYYCYIPEKADTKLMTKLMANAGFQDVNDCYIMDEPDGCDGTIYVCNGKTNSEGACESQGICTSSGCQCFIDWQGIECEMPVCNNPLCNTHEYCSSPDNCQCRNGWTGDECNTAECTPECTGNSECTAPNICSCIAGYTGQNCDENEGTCEPECNFKEECSTTNECVCKNGYSGIDCNPECGSMCNNNQNCSLPNTCSCLKGYIGENCDKRDCNQNFAGLDCKDCAYGWDGELCTIYLLNPGYQWILPVSISSGVLIILILIVILLIIVIYCKVKKKPEPLSNVSMEYKNLSKIESSVEFDDKSKTEL